MFAWIHAKISFLSFHLSEEKFETVELCRPTKNESSLLPDVILIGVRKCGTGALQVFLRRNPDIVSSKWETHFFDNPERYSLGLKEYLRLLLKRQNDDQILLERTPAYFYAPDVEKKIYAAMPSVKLLLIVRDPVTRMISDYVHFHVSRLKEPMKLRRFEVRPGLWVVCV